MICFVFHNSYVISLKHATQKIKSTKKFPQLLCHPNGIYYTYILYLGIVKNILSSNDLRQVGDRWLFHLSQVIRTEYNGMVWYDMIWYVMVCHGPYWYLMVPNGI